METSMVNNFIDQKVAKNNNNQKLRCQLVNQFIIPTTELKVGMYTEDHRTKTGRMQDK